MLALTRRDEGRRLQPEGQGGRQGQEGRAAAGDGSGQNRGCRSPAVVITVVTNTDDFKDVEVVASGAVEPGADLIKVSK